MVVNITPQDIDIRLATQDDMSFIISAWTTAMYDIYPNKYILDFNKKYNSYLRDLCHKSIVVVACLNDSPQDIVSFMVYTTFNNHLVIHYIYTKFDGRKTGIAGELINFANLLNLSIVFTHPAKNEKVMQHFSKQYIFDPSLLGLL